MKCPTSLSYSFSSCFDIPGDLFLQDRLHFYKTSFLSFFLGNEQSYIQYACFPSPAEFVAEVGNNGIKFQLELVLIDLRLRLPGSYGCPGPSRRNRYIHYIVNVV